MYGRADSRAGGSPNSPSRSSRCVTSHQGRRSGASTSVASTITDNTATPASANDFKGNGGFDFKYGLTRSLIADATVRTDFAQVEEDLQQVNLTRFSLFFPEKRDFFLEGQGIFDFGGVQSLNTP